VHRFNDPRRGRLMKKNYERPAIIHTEKLEARAVMCNKANDSCAGGGPIQS
jgi:predicted metal-dependent HD superfamily phosphohydrolase